MDSFNKTKIVDETIRKKKIFFFIVEKKSCTGRSRPSPTVRGKPPTNRNGVIEPRHQVAKEWGRVSAFCWLFFFTCRLFLVFFPYPTSHMSRSAGRCVGGWGRPCDGNGSAEVGGLKPGRKQRRRRKKTNTKKPRPQRAGARRSELGTRL